MMTKCYRKGAIFLTSQKDGSMPTGRTPLPEVTVPGMAYVPFQQCTEILHSPERALESGTLFPVLDKPFRGAGVSGNE